MRWTLPALAFALLLAGCGSTPEPVLTREEAQFLARVRAHPGLNAKSTDQLLAAGRFVCAEHGNVSLTSARKPQAAADLVHQQHAATVTEGLAIADASFVLCGESTPERRYIADILDTPDIRVSMTEAELVKIGRALCEAIGIPGITRQDLQGTITVTKFGPQVAPVVLGAAEQHLCPGKAYSAAPAAAIVPTTPATPSTSLTQGTYEVGIDVAPGKYKTSGSSGCYWARLRENDGSVGDIIDNNYGPGQQVTTLKKGEYFQTRGCGSWAKAE